MSSFPLRSSKRSSLKLELPPFSELRLLTPLCVLWSGILDAANDDRLVWVAFQEVDNHFLPNTRDVYHAPVTSSPRSPHTDPAGTISVVLAATVPVELDFHTAVLVGEDFFPCRANDGRGVRPVDERPRRGPQRPIGESERNACEYVAVMAVAFGRASASTNPLVRHVAYRGQNVRPVGIEMIGKSEFMAGNQLAATAGTVDY